MFHHLTSLNSAYNEVSEEIPCHDNAYIGYTYDQGDDSHVHNELDPTNQLWWNEDAYEDPSLTSAQVSGPSRSSSVAK